MELRRKVHQTLKSVTQDFETLNFNTIISGLMELLNEMAPRKHRVPLEPSLERSGKIYLRMMAPACRTSPKTVGAHRARLFHPDQPWPEVDEEAAKEEEITLIVQVNGKLRDRLIPTR